MSFPLAKGLRANAPAVLAASIQIVLLSCVPSFAMAQSAPVARADVRHYDLPAQSLTTATQQYSRISGVQVMFGTSVGEGVQSAPVHGDFAADDALRQLLAGTGLRARHLDADIVQLEPQAAAEDGVLVTGTLSVEGAAGAAGATGVTEGSGSYTTESMHSATRLDLSQRQTPQSTTVITRQRMDDQAIDSISEAVAATPGMYMSSGDGVGRPLFYSRGFYLDNITYDGAQTAWSSYIPSAVADMAMYDRVEVVRGATGMMQGNANPGGSVNLVRKRPTDEFQASITTSIGRWDNYSTMVDVGGPLNQAGSVRGRVVGSYRSGDSFRDGDSHANDVFYGVLEADVGDDTLVEVGAYRQKQRSNGTWWGGLPTSSTGAHLDLPRSTTVAYDWEHLYQTVNGGFLKVEHDLGGDWKLKFSADKVWQTIDMLGTELWARSSGWDLYPYAWAGLQQANTANYELTLDGRYTLFGREHALVAGVTRNHADFTNYGISGSSYLDTVPDYYDWDASAQPRPVTARTGSDTLSSTQLDSVYATTRLELADPLHLIVGGRLDWYDYDAAGTTSDYSYAHHFSRYLGLTWDIGAQHSLYASFADIFKAQNRVDRWGHLLMPIVGENLELGAKGEYFDGALNASVAVFRTEQKNRARVVEDSSECTMSTDCYEAAGLVRSQGLELEVQGALSPAWQIGGGYTYTKATYVDDASYAEGTPFNAALPRHMFKLSSSYRLPDALDQWRVGGNLSWQSGIYQDIDDSSLGGVVRNRQGSYALVDLFAGFRASAHWDVQLNVSNLFDRTYYQTISSYTMYSYEVYGEPRNYRLTAKYTF